MNNGKKAGVFIYVLLLINISLIIGYYVFSNTFILSNNINIGDNSERIFSNVYEKGDININSVRKYNGNGNGFIDSISCPTNVIMSGSTIIQTGIITNMIYNLGNKYCQGDFNGTKFNLYFNKDYSSIINSSYNGNLLNVINPLSLSTTNIGPTATITGTNGLYPYTYAGDGDMSTYFSSIGMMGSKTLIFDFGSNKSIGHITIRKPSYIGNRFGFGGSRNVNYYNSNGDIVFTNTLSGVRTKSLIDIDLEYRGLSNDISKVVFSVNSRKLDAYEIEFYEVIPQNPLVWEGETTFNDTDNTLITFDSTGVGGGDNIDDNFNSDDYKVTSMSGVYYGNGFQDDDVIPRLYMFGSIDKKENLYNLFWNNYKTNNFIDGNINNNDTLNVKIGNVNNGIMNIDLFSGGVLDYDLKILEFDRNVYKNEFTLLPIIKGVGKNITNESGYIQNNSGSLSLSTIITGNEFVFDFQNKDYAVFLTNNKNETISYRISAIDGAGKQIYINPIDDSDANTIRTLTNHMIIGNVDKNFIGEDFITVGVK